LLLWVMGRIKRLQRGYAVSYCKKVKDCTALACTDGSVPISYTFLGCYLLSNKQETGPIDSR